MKIYSINNVYSNQQKNGYTVKKAALTMCKLLLDLLLRGIWAAV